MPSFARAVFGAALVLAGAAPAAAAPDETRPRIGLVLSGGGARGAAHAGVLKVLEELRVPISCIAGTSMGSIVGGAYASGTRVDEMEEMVASITTEVLFKEKPRREELAIRRKQDDAINYLGPEVGLRDGELRLQKGVVSGVNLEAKLRQLSRVKGYYNFDRLPIPFRAVATDIETGEAVILKSGELANAMRASLSVPAAIAPAELDGRRLVDGMLTQNLPVSVARQLCGDVIIAVNVGTPLAKGEEIKSLLGVTGQMVSILTEQNVQRSLAQLRPGDVLITPDLEGFTTGDFDRMREIIPRGEVAARQAAAQLAQYSIPAEEYAELRRRQSVVLKQDTQPVAEVRIAPMQRVNPKTVLALMDTAPGQPLDAGVLDHDMQRIYGSGDFEHVAYRVVEEDGARVLVVDAIEKSWGPTYARVGLQLFSDLEGDAFYEIVASYRRTWLNRLGAEWRSDLQVGSAMRAFTEFYQPLEPSAWLFIAPNLELRRATVDLYDGDLRVARYDSRSVRAGLDLGTQITRWGELRFGVVSGFAAPRLDVGPAQFEPAEDRVDLGGVRAQLNFDQLDSITFPREGLRLLATAFSSRGTLGADDSYTKWEVKSLAADSAGNHEFHVAMAAGGGATDGDLPAYDQFALGGFLRLSGMRYFQLYGQEYGFGRIVYSNRFSRGALLQGARAGVSLEAGKVRKPLIATNPTDTQYASSLFLGVDTPLGPLYLAYGLASDDANTLYFFLGKPL